MALLQSVQCLSFIQPLREWNLPLLGSVDELRNVNFQGDVRQKVAVVHEDGDLPIRKGIHVSADLSDGARGKVLTISDRSIRTIPRDGPADAPISAHLFLVIQLSNQVPLADGPGLFALNGKVSLESPENAFRESGEKRLPTIGNQDGRMLFHRLKAEVIEVGRLRRPLAGRAFYAKIRAE